MFKITKQELIDFEKEVFILFEDGKLPYLIHLCGGNEDQLIDIFNGIKEEDYVFSTHRTHYHYLLKGGGKEDLLNKIRTGNSMFVFNKNLNFFSSSIVAGNCCIATGTALALKRKKSTAKVYCFVGDGAEDQGHFYEAVRYSWNGQLPIQFIIEDNNRNVDTNKLDRGSQKSIDWPKDLVYRYNYVPTYPHASTGTGKIVNFDNKVVQDYLNKYATTYN